MVSKNFDRTLVAVKRQLKALNAPLYEIGLFDRENDRMLPRVWTGEQVIKSVSWLKVQNFKDNDIFIRPQGSQGLIFFDDLSLSIIKKLKNEGHAPALVIESSPQNYHGWIRVADHPLPEDLSTAISKVIATTYGGDQDSADWRHYGRLAGFTNRKPKYVNDRGQYPFVLLSEGNGKKCENSDELITLGEALLTKRERLKKERQERAIESALNSVNSNDQNPDAFYRSQLSGLMTRYGASLDASRADWMIVNKMIERGFNRLEIESAMLNSPALDTRRNHGDNYIALTLDNALGL
jgi:hypothetical protein